MNFLQAPQYRISLLATEYKQTVRAGALNRLFHIVKMSHRKFSESCVGQNSITLIEGVIYKPYDFSCSCQISGGVQMAAKEAEAGLIGRNHEGGHGTIC